MAKSTTSFQRWSPVLPTSWSFLVFRSHAVELDRVYWSHITARKRIYQELGKKAKWTDPTDLHFQFDDKKKVDLFKTLKGWSDSYNDFDNWVNLNCLMALSSNLETYMSSIIKLALASDPGVLLGISKKVDGVTLLKYGQVSNIDFEPFIVGCTKGEWNSRISEYEKIFGITPKLIRDNLGKMEALRILRNKVGHAFGRDIKESHKHEVRDPLPMERLSRARTISYQELIIKIAREMDSYLMQNHIGEYQHINFYHRMFPSLKKNSHANTRAFIFRKKIGEYGKMPIGKKMSEELVEYYENL